MTMLQKRVSILGATGSIGTSTIAVLEDLMARGNGAFDVEAITIGKKVEAAPDLVRRLRPRFIAAADPQLLSPLREACAGLDVEIGAGPAALVEAAARPSDWVMSAIVGAAALAPTMAAVTRGASVALANKESIVCAGALYRKAAQKAGATILPVDSEHNAVFQVLQGPEHVEQVTLTASGGPFRTWSREQMRAATPEQAKAHPNWSMGPKNSIDSATLMNKGLELIEAAYLFDLPEEKIDILVHPQSIVHSLVAYCDGSVLAQMASPDMRVPIAYALAWPGRAPTQSPRLDLAKIAALHFEKPDLARFPALRLAREALRAGGCAPAVFNAANETAVDEFIAGRIGFLDIASVVENTLDRIEREAAVSIPNSPSSLDEVGMVDTAARIAARQCAGRLQAA